MEGKSPGRYRVMAKSLCGAPYIVGSDDSTKNAIKIAEFYRLSSRFRARIFDAKEKKFLAY